MKTVGFTFLAVISKWALTITTIWALVEFILFLVRKDSFDWDSVIGMVCSFVGIYLFAILAVLANHSDKKKEEKLLDEVMKSKGYSGKTYKFEERLAAMKKQQEEARNGRN
jgi:hypothetical protein